MKSFLWLIVAGMALTGCSKELPSYQMVVGAKKMDCTLHEDPQDIQDDIIAVCKQIWEETPTGDSKIFYCTRRLVLPEEEAQRLMKQLQLKGKKNVGVTTSKGTQSDRFRFFKNRGGMNGLESLENYPESGTIVVSGKELDWEKVEEALRTGEFSLDNIRKFQNLKIEQSQ
jgi:hypothetical protein